MPGIGRGYWGLFKNHPTHDPHFEVVLFAIHESVQGKGLRKRLMNAAIEEFGNHGAMNAILMTDSTMSRQFYERYGYERAISVSMGSAYKPAMDSAHEDTYVYRLDVPAARERAMRGE